MDDGLLDEIITMNKKNIVYNNEDIYISIEGAQYEESDKLHNTMYLNCPIIEEYIDDELFDTFESCEIEDHVLLSTPLPISISPMTISTDLDCSIKLALKQQLQTCCFCGCKEECHREGKLHGFFPCFEVYRCQNCNKFFYQHDHSKKPCFKPKNYIA